jgi:hypothetical protein
MGTKRTMELMELLDIGELSGEHFRTVFDYFYEVFKKEKDKSLEQAIDHCDKKNDSSIIQIDEQYSRSQRWFGPAPHLTTTVIETKSEMIVEIQHCHKEDNGSIKKGSLAKYCTPQAF